MKTLRNPGPVAVVLALVAGGLLAGCSSRSDAGERTGDKTAASPTAAASPVATDSVVSVRMTRGDYEVAVGELKDCLTRSQVELVNEGWDPVDQQGMLLGYRAPQLADERVLEVARQCRAAHFDAAAARFRRDNAARMEPALMKAVQACMKDRGFKVTGREENPDDLVAAAPKDKIWEVADCVRLSSRKLYPDKPVEFP